MKDLPMEFLGRLAKGLAAQFGPCCEVVVHDMTPESSIVIIENGHVSGRKAGDGASRAVLDALRLGNKAKDSLCYLTKTQDGRTLKSSTIYIRDKNDHIRGILSINYDITQLLMAQSAIGQLTTVTEGAAQRIPQNVTQLLDELIAQSVSLVGKPVSLMKREDKVRAISYLNDAGAFLITRSGDKVSKYFEVSKYTLYSYIDEAAQKRRD